MASWMYNSLAYTKLPSIDLVAVDREPHIYIVYYTYASRPLCFTASSTETGISQPWSFPYCCWGNKNCEVDQAHHKLGLTRGSTRQHPLMGQLAWFLKGLMQQHSSRNFLQRLDRGLSTTSSSMDSALMTSRGQPLTCYRDHVTALCQLAHLPTQLKWGTRVLRWLSNISNGGNLQAHDSLYLKRWKPSHHVKFKLL